MVPGKRFCICTGKMSGSNYQATNSKYQIPNCQTTYFGLLTPNSNHLKPQTLNCIGQKITSLSSIFYVLSSFGHEWHKCSRINVPAPDSRLRTPDFRLQIQAQESSSNLTSDSRLLTSDFRLPTSDFRLTTQV